MTHTYDPCQTEVIEAVGGHHLVLAPPGCGKTQILTERIRHAHASGIDYGDMLCLTFTNRAARGMSERMQHELTDTDACTVYVGNVHRFCSKFLFDNAVIPAGTSIIDDADAVSILASYLNEDEMSVIANRSRHRAYAKVFQLAALMHQIEHGHPKALRLHPDCLTSDDISAISTLCRMQGVDFTPQAMSDIYRHTAQWRELSGHGDCDYGERTIISKTLTKMNLAYEYAKYKAANMLIDFEDLLLLTYDALVAADGRHDDSGSGGIRRYKWIQVDEVQDLNPLQLAIVSLLTADDFDTVMYLGDEQQAIFSFMGAKLATIAMLKDRCRGHIHHLSVNHRSRRYLLDVFNTYAADVLRIDRELLPVADNDEQGRPSDLAVLASDDYDSEIADTAALTKRLTAADDHARTAIVVASNADADAISSTFGDEHIAHFKVSGDDIFETSTMKMLLAHANVLTRETDFLAWSRLLCGMGVFQTAYAARNFVRSSLNHAIMPTDYLRGDGRTYTRRFVSAYEDGDIVVFDTETTGLNVFEDDIVQIAAVRMRGGKPVPGSELSLYIATERHIPEKLGDITNPIIEEMGRHELLSHATALRQFLEYVGDAPLLGHNADFDYNILANNLRRYCGITDIGSVCPVYFDSLRLIRLLEPHFKVYKLKALLEQLGLQGKNSHLADEDVNATCSLVAYCYSKASACMPAQEAFLARERVKSCANILRAYYGGIYAEARQRLYTRTATPHDGSLGPLADELKRVYDQLLADGKASELPTIGRVLDYIAHDVVDNDAEPSLIEQLNAHIMVLNTMKEADLCGSSCLSERVFVTTVHKAKGLEFDNVIVFDAVDGRWPNYYSQDNQAQLDEDARKFYVAMTRAERRLVIAYAKGRRSPYSGTLRSQSITRFMVPLLPFFSTMP